MAMRKKVIKPFSSLRFDFVESMENVCQQSINLLLAIKTVIDQSGDASAVIKMPAGVRGILIERHDALRNALIGEE